MHGPCPRSIPGPSIFTAMQPQKAWNRRLLVALGAYLALGLIAAFTLDGWLRIALWAFLGYLALKTLVHSEDEKME
jgi:hypothetical protein